MKILLLNPPGKKIYIRDYYCSKVSKTGYIYHPVDLLILSGILSQEHEIFILDCIVERIDYTLALKKIKEMNIEILISLVGAVSFFEDFSFLKRIKEEKKEIKIFATGDCLMENGEEILQEQKWLDGIILDFTSIEIQEFLRGIEKNYPTLIYRSKEGKIVKNENREGGEFKIPIPRHDLFLPYKYTYPFVRKLPFATVLTDYGCPFNCSFCIMGTLKYKYRPIDNLIEEINFIHKLGIREIYFSDQSFGAVRSRTKELCKYMEKLSPKFGWVCLSRVDITDDEMLLLMKKAGCHTIIYGVESGNEAILKRYKKNLTLKQIKEGFNRCRKYKIRPVGTFILGLPGETEDDIKKTIRFAKELDCAYASFNVAIPRARTDLRKEMKEKGLLKEKNEEMDQSGTKVITGTGILNAEDILKWHKKAIRQFYLRPSYLFKRLISLNSWDEFKINLKEAISILGLK
jgi:radical SAM superfamily enzyme YgiQ (UPF0313 family)